MAVSGAVHLAKGTVPTAPSGDLSIYADTADATLKCVDQSGNIVVLGTPVSATPATNYRFVKRTYILQGTTTFSKQNGTVALHVRGWGAGGGAAGVQAATNLATSIGGGGGAYSEVWLSSLTGPFTCVVGLGGTGGAGNSNGVSGTDTTFADNGVNKLTAKAGVLGTTAGGIGAGTSLVVLGASGAGGAASGGTGDTKFDGGQGAGPTFRLSATQGVGGSGGNAACGGQGAMGAASQGTGNAGGFPGGGGGGTIDVANTSRTGGAGANGLLIVDEYA